MKTNIKMDIEMQKKVIYKKMKEFLFVELNRDGLLNYLEKNNFNIEDRIDNYINMMESYINNIFLMIYGYYLHERKKMGLSPHKKKMVLKYYNLGLTFNQICHKTGYNPIYVKEFLKKAT